MLYCHGMAHVLFAWIGTADKKGMSGSGRPGPIASALDSRSFERVVLLSNRPTEDQAYLDWLKSRTKASVVLRPAPLRSPTHYTDIYRAATDVVAWALAEYGASAKLTFHLSPGTPAMSSIWIILAKTRYPAALIQSSPEAGVEDAEVPFEIAAEFIPDIVKPTEEELERTASGPQPAVAEFKNVIARSASMRRLLERARLVAAFSKPVLIEGETGTGKELLARAIHNASSRAGKPFVPVNCGAIPRELFESEFFGHKKGAFTGAVADRDGHFLSADGGTLFLDEVGELQLDHQVRLLRVLQEKKIVKVGESRERSIDVRVISATNRNLLTEVVNQRFREDLLYRLAILPLRLPPLREREGDLGLLIDYFVDQMNQEGGAAATPKTVSAPARRLLLAHKWPGNVRELQGTLERARVFSRGPQIDEISVREALLSRPTGSTEAILGRSLGGDFSLEATIEEVKSHYLERALAQAGGKRSDAANLVGFKSYQRFNKWLEKLKIDIE